MTDKIEKRVTLKAAVSRVWRALTDAAEFGRWFGVTLEGAFLEGKTMRGKFDFELDEAALMEAQRKAGIKPAGLKIPEGMSVFCTIERIEPERYFSFRWVPYPVDAEAEPEREPTTLIEFHLEPTPEGTLLTVIESGFDRVPEHRRARAFLMNEGGWVAQCEKLRKYVEA